MTTDPELERLRAAMDAVNRRLVATLHERARLCHAIGAWKKRHGIAAIDPVREQEMLATMLHELPEHGFPRASLAAILHEVFAASRAIVEHERG